MQLLYFGDEPMCRLLQLFSNAMVAAGLVEDPRTVVTNMNDLLTLALEKH